MPCKRRPSLATAFGIILVLITFLNFVNAEEEPWVDFKDKRPFRLLCYSGMGPLKALKKVECVPFYHFNIQPYCHRSWQYDPAADKLTYSAGCTYMVPQRSCQQIAGDTIKCICQDHFCNAHLKCPEKFSKICKNVNTALVLAGDVDETTTIAPPPPPRLPAPQKTWDRKKPSAGSQHGPLLPLLGFSMVTVIFEVYLGLYHILCL
uniref:Uncharacterized protein n=1 Tax=Panagrellus redivivus TaxID=6233 RepID=A0A7E4ZYK7_PANRE